MATPGPNIYQWLKEVPKGDSPAVQDANNPAMALRVDATLAKKNPLGALKEPRDLEPQSIPHNRHSNSHNEVSDDRKRPRELRSPSQTPGTDPHNQYERRPRHKTRKDRYDYKTPRPREKPPVRSGKGKSKGSKVRKHTMNEEFHASNVAPGRLTLRSSTRMGIFSKGKASSPTNVRGDLGFSEATFLSYRDRSQPQQQASSGCLTDTPRQKYRQRLSYPRFDFQPPTGLDQESIPFDGRSTYADNQALPMTEENAPSFDQNKRQATRGKTESIIHQIEHETKIPEESRSATPYTWSVTEDSGSHQSRALDAYLLSLLRVGLFSRRNSEEHNHAHSKSDCCDIEELARRLQDRKAHWEVETDVTHSSNRRRKDLDRDQQHQKPIQLPIQSSPVNPMESMTGEPESKKTAKSLADQVYGNASTESVSGIHEPQSSATNQQAGFNSSDTHAVDSTSDEEFFKMLDEAFHAIVSPETQLLNPSENIPQESEVSQYHVPSNPRELPGLDPESAALLTCDPVDVNSHGLHRTGKPRPSEPAVYDCAPGYLELGLEASSRGLNVAALDREILPRSSGTARARHPRQPLSSPTANSHTIPSTIPAGFWRQNRLY